MPRRARALCFLLCLLSLPAAAAQAAAEVNPAVQKTLKTLIGAIRYDRHAVALRQLGLAQMADGLLGEQKSRLSAAERQEFIRLFAQLLEKVSFKAGHELFAYLDAVLYDPVRQRGDQVRCRCTVVVHRELKKQEIPIEWVLMAQDGGYVVVDMVTGGESTVAALHKDQILPLLQEGGAQALLAAMQKKLQEAS